MLNKSHSCASALCTISTEKLIKLNLSSKKFTINEVDCSTGRCSRTHADWNLLTNKNFKEKIEDNHIPYRKGKQFLDESIIFSDEEFSDANELLDSSIGKFEFKTCLNFSNSKSDSELNLSHKSEKIDLVKYKNKISIGKEMKLPIDFKKETKCKMIVDDESLVSFSNKKYIIVSDSDNDQTSINSSYTLVNQHLQDDNLNSLRQNINSIKVTTTTVYASNSDSSEDNFENYINSVKKKVTERVVFDNYDSDFIVSDNSDLEYYSTLPIKKKKKSKSVKQINCEDTQRKNIKVILSSSSEFEDSSGDNSDSSLSREKCKVHEKKNIGKTKKKKIMKKITQNVINSSFSDSEDDSDYIFQKSSEEDCVNYADYSETSLLDKNYLDNKKKYIKETDLKSGKNTIQDIVIISSNSEKENEIPEKDLRLKTTKQKVIKKQADETSCEQLSFLSSLDQDTPLSRAHVDSIPYLKNFKKLREELAYKLYTLYNAKIFGNSLPRSMNIKWNPRLTKTAGFFYYTDKKRDSHINSRIDLSIKVIDCPGRLRDTLIHEMCHAATRIISEKNEAHGPIWKSWASKANKAFPELSLIKTCHSYKINCKYTYKCLTCGYSFGRHSKSLDTKRKVCGRCHGKFELIVNYERAKKHSKKPHIELPSSLSTPRTPGPFALFVKDNYGLIKKSQSDMKHKDVMQMLSKQFAEMKMETLELK